MSRRARALLLAAALATPLVATPAWAVLGGQVAPADGAARASVRTLRTAASHTVHETTWPDGSRLQEYADAQGRVFMVSWRMRYKPRLDTLLGSYHANYRAALAQHTGQARTLDVAHGPLRARASGYLGQFSGSAWLPQAMPLGFDTATQR